MTRSAKTGGKNWRQNWRQLWPGKLWPGKIGGKLWPVQVLYIKYINKNLKQDVAIFFFKFYIKPFILYFFILLLLLFFKFFYM